MGSELASRDALRPPHNVPAQLPTMTGPAAVAAGVSRERQHNMPAVRRCQRRLPTPTTTWAAGGAVLDAGRQGGLGAGQYREAFGVAGPGGELAAQLGEFWPVAAHTEP